MNYKILIANKLKNFFINTKPESFLKVFVISFLFDKINYIEKIVGTENSLNMLDKYIYNLEQNVKSFKKIEKYHSIYVKYDFDTKCIKYYLANDFKKFDNISSLSSDDKKKFLIKEFKVMMYKELEMLSNLSIKNGLIISNGFYIEDAYGRYPDYEGNFSDIMDIFSDVEVCNIIGLNDKHKVYVDDKKKFFVFARHISIRNSEVIGYVDMWRKFFDNKLFYFAINNPNQYSKKMINDFNIKYNYIIQQKYNFLLSNKDIFSLIENYLLHIKHRVNAENNLRYHQDISTIFKLMNNNGQVKNCSEYLLNF